MPLYSFRLIRERGMRKNTRGGIYHMNQSQQNITSHIKSYCDGVIALILPHSFSVTPH